MNLFDRLRHLEARHPVPTDTTRERAWVKTISDDDLDVCCRVALDHVVRPEDAAAFARLASDRQRFLAVSSAP